MNYMLKTLSHVVITVTMVTMEASSTDHRAQFIGQGTAHEDTPSRVLLKCGGSPSRWNYISDQFHVCSDHLEFLSIAP
jgi:hypothetical protein